MAGGAAAAGDGRVVLGQQQRRPPHRMNVGEGASGCSVEARGMSSMSSTLDGVPFGTVGGEAVSLAEALRLLKLDFSEASGRPAADWPAAVVERVVILQAAQELDLEPTSEETQSVMAEFRRVRNLHSA